MIPDAPAISESVDKLRSLAPKLPELLVRISSAADVLARQADRAGEIAAQVDAALTIAKGGSGS